MNYKKSLLSLVTIMALGNTVMADTRATYLPLASDTVDSTWILFGVNGFSTGTPTVLGAAPASPDFASPMVACPDTLTSDALATTCTAASSMLAVQALADASISALSVGIDMTGVPVAPVEEAVRSMYLKVNSSSPNVRLEYKVSLEGKAINIKLGTSFYSATIAQNSTWAAAQTATAISSSGVTTTTVNSMAITDLLDFNFSDNPTNPDYFDASVHKHATGGAASFYHFNALNQRWEVNQKGAPDASQDFTQLNRGKAYWGRADRTEVLGAQNIDNGGSVGLVLGEATQSGGLPDVNMYEDDSNVSILSSGWNMLSFDEAKPFVRHAATGLVLTSVGNGDIFTVTDDSGLNTLTLAAIATAGDEVDAKYINTQIESAKLRGLLPQSFYLKAFRGVADGTLVFLSDKKFSISLTSAASGIAVTTLWGKNPYSAGAPVVVTELNATAVESAYGEYTALTNVLVGTGTVNDLNSTGSGVAKIGFTAPTITAINPTVAGTAVATTSATGYAGVSVAASLAAAKTKIDALTASAAGLKPVATQIDTNFDGTATGDMLLVAYGAPFSLQDQTYTRTFTTSAAANTLPITISGSPSNATVIPNAMAAAAYATLIGDQNATTGVFAGAVDATTLVIASNATSSLDLKDVQSSTVDLLSPASTTDKLAKGAVSGVYSLDSITRLPLVQHEFTFTSVADFYHIADGNESIDINVTDSNGTIYNDFNVTALALSPQGWFDKVVTSINTLMRTNGMHGFAQHDYNTTASLTTAKIYVTGVDVAGITIDANATMTTTLIKPTANGDTYAATAGGIGDLNDTSGTNGDIVADLKSNPAYAPNFARYGPLYTLNEAGYNVSAMLKATTEMDVATAAGTIKWGSIDITRYEDEWFKNNEFSLFDINHNSGYWVYLATKAPSGISVTSATLTPSAYSYYFKNTTPYTTVNNMTSGQISVVINGLSNAAAGSSTASSSAYITIDGEEVQLVRQGTTTTYAADISTYALKQFAQSTSPIDFTVRVVNGKGESVEVTSTLNPTIITAMDYTPPVFTTVPTYSSGTITLTGGTDTANFYVFKDYIPELQANRVSPVLAATVPAVAGVGSFTNVCSNFAFGSTNALHIVAADGAINTSNISNAQVVQYEGMTKGARVLTQTYATPNTAAIIPTIYDASCNNVTPVGQTDLNNVGVSLKTLTSGATSTMSFEPQNSFTSGTTASFGQDPAWTSNYALTGGGTAIVQIQNADVYAGQRFYIDYNGVLYYGTFPLTSAAASASITTTIGLTAVNTATVNTIVP